MAVLRIHSRWGTSSKSARETVIKMPLFYSEFLLIIFHSQDICGRTTVCFCLCTSENRQTSEMIWRNGPILAYLTSCPFSCPAHAFSTSSDITFGLASARRHPLDISYYPGFIPAMLPLSFLKSNVLFL